MFVIGAYHSDNYCCSSQADFVVKRVSLSIVPEDKIAAAIGAILVDMLVDLDIEISKKVFDALVDKVIEAKIVRTCQRDCNCRDWITIEEVSEDGTISENLEVTGLKGSGIEQLLKDIEIPEDTVHVKKIIVRRRWRLATDKTARYRYIEYPVRLVKDPKTGNVRGNRDCHSTCSGPVHSLSTHTSQV
jgi:hypothetical protein